MPPEHAQRLSDLIPTAQVAMLDRGGTLLQLDAPDVIADLITRLARHHAHARLLRGRDGDRLLAGDQGSLLQLWAKWSQIRLAHSPPKVCSQLRINATSEPASRARSPALSTGTRAGAERA
jgi:hypothetical protein